MLIELYWTSIQFLCVAAAAENDKTPGHPLSMCTCSSDWVLFQFSSPSWGNLATEPEKKSQDLMDSLEENREQLDEQTAQLVGFSSFEDYFEQAADKSWDR